MWHAVMHRPASCSRCLRHAAVHHTQQWHKQPGDVDKACLDLQHASKRPHSRPVFTAPLLFLHRATHQSRPLRLYCWLIRQANGTTPAHAGGLPKPPTPLPHPRHRRLALFSSHPPGSLEGTPGGAYASHAQPVQTTGENTSSCILSSPEQHSPSGLINSERHSSCTVLLWVVACCGKI